MAAGRKKDEVKFQIARPEGTKFRSQSEAGEPAGQSEHNFAPTACPPHGWRCERQIEVGTQWTAKTFVCPYTIENAAEPHVWVFSQEVNGWLALVLTSCYLIEQVSGEHSPTEMAI